MFLSGIADEAGRSIMAQVRAHRELGWNHIELRNVEGEGIALMSDAAFDDVYATITEANLHVSCFASALANWARPITTDFSVDVEELRRAIPRMHRLKTRLIRVMSYPNFKEAPWPDRAWRKEVFRRLRELAQMAGDGGVTLVHENCDGWGGQSPEHTEILLGEVDSPYLNLVFDTGNPVSHGQNSWAYYRAVRAHIVYVHIKDAVATPEGGTRYTFAGDGEGCVREIVADLMATGYDGGFSIEPHIASVVHTGGGPVSPETLYGSYIDYGHRFEEVFRELDQKEPSS